MLFGCWLMWAQGTMCWMGFRSPMWRGNFKGERRRPIMKYSYTLLWAVQKWLNLSRCHLECILGWALGSTYYMGIKIPMHKGAIFRVKRVSPRHAWTCPAVDILKARGRTCAELVQCWCPLECTRWDAHWHNLANTFELSVCGGSVALCQITLTTCC